MTGENGMTEFVDFVVLHLRAGKGGNGCVSVRREKFKPLGGPDGGNGGDGGDIVLVADSQVTTLLDFHYRPHWSSDNGAPGQGRSKNGKNGSELVLRVPVGTIVQNDRGESLADLNTPGMKIVVAGGGRGGLGNQALATKARKAPGFALLGTQGFEGNVRLELKVVADVALVGFPSAGKSSLISVLSKAKPKVADYPFTTIHPHLGVVDAGGVRLTMADVPGLIPGASKGKGLGLEFLRHVERCSVLVHVLDCATLEPGRDPMSDLSALIDELKNYPLSEGQVLLQDRPRLVVLNKIDVPEAKDLAELVSAELTALGFRTFLVSAIARLGLEEFLYELGSLVSNYRDQIERESAQLPPVVIKPRSVDEPSFHVRQEVRGDSKLFRIIGAKPERWVEQTDFSNDEAVGFLADRLTKLGIDDALFAAGALPGATVTIGEGEGQVFDWEPSILSSAELVSSPRGSDFRLNQATRATRAERKEIYMDRMDAKAEARSELEKEKKAGIFSNDE